MRVGEKEISEQAAIVARYSDLFTREQLGALADAAAALDGDALERATRLRLTCEAGIASAELAEREDALENALLAVRVRWQENELPLRAAAALLATLPEYADRDALGVIQREASVAFNGERLGLLQDRERLAGELSGEADPVRRSEQEKAISLRGLADVLDAACVRTAPAFDGLRARWFERLLGPEREEIPDVVAHGVDAASLAARGHVHERALRARLHGDPPRDRLRYRGRAWHPPRSRRPPAEVAARVRHRLGSRRGSCT